MISLLQNRLKAPGSEPIESALQSVAQRGAVTSRNAPVQRRRAGTKGRRLTCGVGPTLSTITATEDPAGARRTQVTKVAAEPLIWNI